MTYYSPLDYFPRNDRYLDPPEAPTHEACKMCHDMFDRDDLDDYGYCPECAEMIEEGDE